jgi:hypothetical protein
MLSAVERLPDARLYVSRGQYFVVHAPRQTGKSTSLGELAQQLTAEGEYFALRFSCETAGLAGDDYGRVERLLLDEIRAEAHGGAGLASELLPPDPWPEAQDGNQLRAALTAWVARCPRPLVLLFDEIDALHGQGLLYVLRQLRAGYTSREGSFVHSAVLCGVRDVRDYKAASGGDPTGLASASPFNIKVKSMRMGDFTQAEVAELYAQHTAETGQEFTRAAVERAFCYTQGQPWLVNALATEIIDEMRIEPPAPITADHIDVAKERLILARATHLDSLVSKLHEPRVKRVIEPLIAGIQPELDPTFDDDVAFVRDLGLIAQGVPIRVANPIYQEVIVRVLGGAVEELIVAKPSSFRFPDGRLDFARLLQEFVEFWKENGEFMTGQAAYREAAPQLIMMAYLHRIVNGAGHISREYGVGRGRIDLLVRQPYTAPDGSTAWQREALELKVWRNDKPDPLAAGLEQLDAYLDKLSLDTGVLVIFDSRTEAPPITERVHFTDTETPSGRTVTLLRV